MTLRAAAIVGFPADRCLDGGAGPGKQSWFDLAQISEPLPPTVSRLGSRWSNAG